MTHRLTFGFVVGILALPAFALDISEYQIIDLSHSYNNDTLYWPTSPTKFEKEELSFGETANGIRQSDQHESAVWQIGLNRRQPIAVTARLQGIGHTRWIRREIPARSRRAAHMATRRIHVNRSAESGRRFHTHAVPGE